MTSPAVHPLRELLGLNTRLLLNCLKDVSDAVARQRVANNTNSLVFLACHLIDARCFMGKLLGQPIANPLAEHLKDARSIDEIEAFPPITEIRVMWIEVAERLEDAFSRAGPSDLAGESTQRFPIEDRSVFGGCSFLVQHESYHIGQMAMIRKAFGLGAMEYGP
jgi:uncharacterized damage-inducible protein DinB